MPFPDRSFDIVVSTVSMHHWKQPEACLNEIYRVLKNNSYALIYDLVSDTSESTWNGDKAGIRPAEGNAVLAAQFRGAVLYPPEF
ncbi:MAG: class I SAM-dependent methyltransferase [Planctomycetes bacterium]|nr:class I SAM-dependent methyltransferase [Planctomycetota bacterium]